MQNNQRREFLKKAGVGMVAGGALSASTIANAQSLPVIKWRLASSFGKSLDTIYGAAENMSEFVSVATGGKFQIKVFPGGEIVPPFGVLDATKDGTVEICHTANYYYVGKDPAFALDCAVPFGMNNRMMDAWIRHGNGMKLLREFFATYGVVNFPCGNTGTQMGGFYRKEINKPADIKGLKTRIAGINGDVWKKLGAEPQQLPGGEIYTALERGTIDAAEWVGPYDDKKLGLYKVAKNYYYPGWWEYGPQLSVLINSKAFDSLPKEYKAILEIAIANSHIDMIAKYDAKNPIALKEMVAEGVKLKQFSKELMDVFYKTTMEVYKELDEKSPAWKTIFADYWKFRNSEIEWFRLAEGSAASYIYSRKN